MRDLAKNVLRREVLSARRELTDRASRSAKILRRLRSLEAYRRAERVMFYVSARSEVATHEEIRRVLHARTQVVVPFCQESQLTPFALRDWEELAPGSFGILEPAEHLRGRRERIVDPRTLDVVVVPGVAFSPSGERLGHGRGFYDRLLSQMRPSTISIGLAFACQLRSDVPSRSHDVCMDVVITDTDLYHCSTSPEA